jgi:hypothetical protein
MFGFGKRNRRQVRNDTFSGSRLRNAALAGAGMLAWRWWRNRQSTNRPTSNPDRSFTESSAGSGGAF